MNSNEIKIFDNSKNKDNNVKKNTILIEENRNKNIFFFGAENMEKKENIDNNITIKKENLNFNESVSYHENILKEVKYGIDENGNPMNVNEYYKNIGNKSKRPRPIAYIIKDNNNDNILVDLNGNKIMNKNKEGDYEFPFQYKILIKDFDVKHPELRITGERIYSIDNNKKNKINNDNMEKNETKKNIDCKKEEIVDEISFQIDSTETDEITSSKTKNNINYYIKRNFMNKKECMNIWKYRYGNYNNNNIKTNKLKREKSIPTRKEYNFIQKRIKNLSFSKSMKPNNQEIITRTNSILNSNNCTIDLKKNLTKNKENIIEKYSLKENMNNNPKKELKKIFINRDYYNKNNNISSIPNININKTYFINSKKRKHNSKIRNNIILSSVNSQKKIINNKNYYTKGSKYSLSYNYINNSINKSNISSKVFTSPSSNISKNKKKGIFNDLNHKNNKSNIFSFSNDIINNNHTIINRVKKNLMNKDLMIKLNRNEVFKIKNTKFINKSSNESINKEENIHPNKKRRDLLLHSSIRTIEFSENSIIDCSIKDNVYLKETQNKRKNNNKTINKANKISKLLKKIPMFPKKKNKKSMKQCSILTKEANDMIIDYLSKKNKSINRKSARNNSFLINENINKIYSTHIINRKNKSYNKEKKK